MTTKQVGWYDGERVHQMNARPVGPVPRHLAHTAGWVAVFVETAPATGTVVVRERPVYICSHRDVACAEVFDKCLACPERRATLTPAMKADAALFEGEHFTVFATPQETAQ